MNREKIFLNKPSIKSIIFFLFALFFVLLVGIFVWQGIYLPKDIGSSKEVIFKIEKGQGAKEISLNLSKQGIIKSSLLFRLYALTKGAAGRLQAGEYLLSPSMTIPEIVNKFFLGEVIKEKITIIEGWNLRDIGWYLEGKGMFQAEELFELVGFPMAGDPKKTDLPSPKDFSSEFDFLKDKPKNLSLEGYLFPDTYEIKKGESLEEIVRKILKNFDKKLTPSLREEITKQGKLIFEVITMASLIEKEVRTLEDKKLVSGILWKRLGANMPLQVDATITYITGKQTTKISIEETQIDSPYNTYKYPGLPLGPIANPGLESILAAIFPQESEYWYYLSTTEGQTIFSKTLAEHNIAKAKYLK